MARVSVGAYSVNLKLHSDLVLSTLPRITPLQCQHSNRQRRTACAYETRKNLHQLRNATTTLLVRCSCAATTSRPLNPSSGDTLTSHKVIIKRSETQYWTVYAWVYSFASLTEGQVFIVAMLPQLPFPIDGIRYQDQETRYTIPVPGDRVSC